MKNIFDKKTQKQIISYAIIGLGNTIGGLLAIFFLLSQGVQIYLANFIVYSIGIVISYLLNSKYTFVVNYLSFRFVKFILANALAYLINITVIYIIFKYLPYSNKYIVQTIGSASYTITGFIMTKYWVMK